MTITIFKKASGVKRAIAAVLAATTLVSVAACGSNNNSLASSDTLNASKGKTTKITVGVCPGPYGDMVDKVIAPLLKDDGFELKPSYSTTMCSRIRRSPPVLFKPT